MEGGTGIEGAGSGGGGGGGGRGREAGVEGAGRGREVCNYMGKKLLLFDKKLIENGPKLYH